MMIWGVCMYCQILYPQIDIENITTTTSVDFEIEESDRDSTILVNSNILYSENFILSLFEVQNIITHRDKYGDILEECELYRCGFTKDRILELLPYLNLKSNLKNKLLGTVKNLTESKWKHKIILGSSLPENSFSSALRYGKLKLQKGNIFQFNLSFQSDAFEKGLDYFGSSCRIKIPKLETNIILGKYIIDWNQGLVKNTPFATQFTQSNVRLFHNIQNIRSSSSWNEYQGYWGVTISKQILNHKLYFSSGIDFRDGNLATIQDDSFNKFIQTGKHINRLEIDRKNSVQVWNNFFGYTYKSEFWNANFSISNYHFTKFFKGEKQLSIPEISISAYPWSKIILSSNLAYINRISCYKIGALYQAEQNLGISFTHEEYPIDFPCIDQSEFLPIKSNTSQSIAVISIIPANKQNINIGLINGDPIYRLKDKSIQESETNFFLDFSHQSKKEKLKIHLQSLDTANYRMNWVIDYKIGKNVRIQQKSILQGTREKLGGLIALGTFWEINRFQLKTIIYAYESNKQTLYITRNTIQLPWQLQIVSGSGIDFWGLVSYKFNKFSLHSSLELQLKQESETYLWQKPRIFVQITIP